ncbi:MAG: hypothetical protein RLZZ436_345 [Planctomycetota bacterium]
MRLPAPFPTKPTRQNATPAAILAAGSERFSAIAHAGHVLHLPVSAGNNTGVLPSWPCRKLHSGSRPILHCASYHPPRVRRGAVTFWTPGHRDSGTAKLSWRNGGRRSESRVLRLHAEPSLGGSSCPRGGEARANEGLNTEGSLRSLNCMTFAVRWRSSLPAGCRSMALAFSQSPQKSGKGVQWMLIPW